MYNKKLPNKIVRNVLGKTKRRDYIDASIELSDELEHPTFYCSFHGVRHRIGPPHWGCFKSEQIMAMDYRRLYISLRGKYYRGKPAILLLKKKNPKLFEKLTKEFGDNV